MLTFLINDILDFAQMRASKYRKVASQFHLKEAIHEVINILRFKADSMKIEVSSHFSNFTSFNGSTLQLCDQNDSTIINTD